MSEIESALIGTDPHGQDAKFMSWPIMTQHKLHTKTQHKPPALAQRVNKERVLTVVSSILRWLSELQSARSFLRCEMYTLGWAGLGITELVPGTEFQDVKAWLAADPTAKLRGKLWRQTLRRRRSACRLEGRNKPLFWHFRCSTAPECEHLRLDLSVHMQRCANTYASMCLYVNTNARCSGSALSCDFFRLVDLVSCDFFCLVVIFSCCFPASDTKTAAYL